MPDHSLAIPRTLDERFSLLGNIRDLLTRKPELENAPLGITAEAATAHFEALSTARNGVAAALSATARAHDQYDIALAALRTRFRDAVTELAQLLEDDDPRWYECGLERPSDPATPGEVGAVHLTTGGPGTLITSWDGARRADYFRIFKQVLEVDEEPVYVDHTTETTYVMHDLPAGKTVRITVTGVNHAGEGHASTPVESLIA